MASGNCTCGIEEAKLSYDSSEVLHYKIGSIASVLVAGALGVSLPLLSKRIPALNPQNDMFFMVKAFAAGVILATGFIHILPEAFESLSSPCLNENPWGKFPFTGFVAMLSSIGTLMVDSFATGYYHRQHFNSSKQVPADEELGDEHAGHIHVHTHATHGHAHGSTTSSEGSITSELIRSRIISQVRSMSCSFYSFIPCIILRVSLGATARLLFCNLKVTNSIFRNSFSACKGKIMYIYPSYAPSSGRLVP